MPVAIFADIQEGLPSRALDIGCAVGRSTFELAREFEEVVGIDFSSAFIAKCQQLKILGNSEYSLTVEGNIIEKKTAQVDQAIVRHSVPLLILCCFYATQNEIQLGVYAWAEAVPCAYYTLCILHVQ